MLTDCSGWHLRWDWGLNKVSNVHSVLLLHKLWFNLAMCILCLTHLWPPGLSTSWQNNILHQLPIFDLFKTDIYTLLLISVMKLGGHHYWALCPFVILPDCDACFSILPILLYASAVYLSISMLSTSLDHFVPQKCTRLWCVLKSINVLFIPRSHLFF